jgi:hypothetical protein
MAETVKPWLDAETVKTLIAALSALVAVLTFTITLRSRARERRESFEKDRGALVKDMTENDYLLGSLKLRTMLVKEKLEALAPRAPGHLADDVAKSLAHVRVMQSQLNEVPTAITGQDFRTVKFTKKSVQILKDVRFAVDDMSANLRQPGWQDVLGNAEGVAQRVENYLVAQISPLPSPGGPPNHKSAG